MPVTREDMRTVERVASRFVRLVPSSELDDAVSDGMLVLEQAVESWESDLALRQQFGNSREAFIASSAKRGMVDGIRQRNGREFRKQRFRDSALRLDQPVKASGSDDRETTVLDTVGSPDTEIARVGGPQYVAQMLDLLPAREREVVERHVLKGEPEASIAKDFGVSESRISQLRARALSRLRDGPDALSQRELEVLQQVANDKTNKEIASKLLIAEETVKHHLRHVHAKLGVSHRAGAVASGFRQGLLR